MKANRLPVLLTIAVPVLGALGTLAVMLGYGERELGLLFFLLWGVLPYGLVALLTVVAAGRATVSWVALTVVGVLITLYGAWSMRGYVRSEDGQAALVWVFLPMVQLAAVVVLGLVLVLELSLRSRAEQRLSVR